MEIGAELGIIVVVMIICVEDSENYKERHGQIKKTYIRRPCHHVFLDAEIELRRDQVELNKL